VTIASNGVQSRLDAAKRDERRIDKPANRRNKVGCLVYNGFSSASVTLGLDPRCVNPKLIFFGDVYVAITSDTEIGLNLFPVIRKWLLDANPGAGNFVSDDRDL